MVCMQMLPENLAYVEFQEELAQGITVTGDAAGLGPVQIRAARVHPSTLPPFLSSSVMRCCECSAGV